LAVTTGTEPDSVNPLVRIIAHAWKDDDFRQALLANAKQALQQEFGAEIADDTEITVVEESLNHVYIVLPRRLDLALQAQLSEQELAEWAAGHTPHTTCMCSGITDGSCESLTPPDSV